MEHMFSALGCGEFVGEPTAKTAVGICKQDSAKGKFPVKMRAEQPSATRGQKRMEQGRRKECVRHHVVAIVFGSQ